VRTVDEDYDSLLGQRQRWPEDGDVDINGTDFYASAITTTTAYID